MKEKASMIMRGYMNNQPHSELLQYYDAIEDKDFICDLNGGTPLIGLAASYADAYALVYLINAGADVRAMGGYSKVTNALHELAKSRTKYNQHKVADGDVYKCAQLLLGAGLSALKKDSNGKNAYFLAAEEGNFEMMRAMREHGVMLGLTDEKGNNAMHMTVRGAGRVAERLARDEKLLLDRSADARLALDPDHQKRLILDAESLIAADYERMEDFVKTVKELMLAEIEYDDKNNEGKTPQELAVYVDAKKIAMLLRGEITGEDTPEEAQKIATGGMTLMQAVAKRDYKAMEALVATGADAEEISDEFIKGLTPLQYACNNCDEQAVRILTAAGARPYFKNNDGQNAFYYLIAGMGNAAMRWNTFKADAPKKILKALLENGLDASSAADKQGNTPLILACSARPTRPDGRTALEEVIAEELLTKGADINAQNASGQTALMCVCGMPERDEFLSVLLENGADISKKDGHGNAALHYAALCSNKASGKTYAQLLYSFGKPDAAAVNNDGKTALDIAQQRDNEPLVKFLLGKYN